MTDSVYHFSVPDIDNNPVSLENFRNKVLLIVNTASHCGFTRQYSELEELYNEFHDRGFIVLAFPCNQFAGQEPGSAEEIKSFCSLTYNITFPIFAKTDVNGENAAALFKFLKKECPGFLGNAVKWNFTKFLIRKNGIPFKRYAPVTSPHKLKKDIEKLLSE